MKDKHNTIIAVDKTGVQRVVIGDLSGSDDGDESTLIIRETEKRKSHDDCDFKWFDTDSAIVELWETLNSTQQEAIKEVIQNYRNEIFSLECSINEGTVS